MLRGFLRRILLGLVIFAVLITIAFLLGLLSYNRRESSPGGPKLGS